MDSVRDKYINPFTDFGFKKLFGSELNKDLLLDFLNELIKDRGRIQELTYLKNEQLGRMQIDRGAVFDIYCESETGEKFIVELQKAKQLFFKDRSVFYSTFPIQEQALRGNWNFRLDSVYTICILDFVFEEEKDCSDFFCHNVQLMDTVRKKVFFDKLMFIYLEMPKFTKQEDELETHFDKWLYVFKNLSKLQNKPAKLQERVFSKLFKIAEIEKFTREERQNYEDSLKHYRDMQNVIDTQRLEGMAEGLEQGRVEGRAEGIKEGETIGVKKIAKSMLQDGMSVDLIVKLTGLKQGDIDKLK